MRRELPQTNSREPDRPSLRAFGPERKVRAPHGRTLGNTQEGRPSDSATESKPPRMRGKGETVG